MKFVELPKTYVDAAIDNKMQQALFHMNYYWSNTKLLRTIENNENATFASIQKQ